MLSSAVAVCCGCADSSSLQVSEKENKVITFISTGRGRTIIKKKMKIQNRIVCLTAALNRPSLEKLSETDDADVKYIVHPSKFLNKLATLCHTSYPSDRAVYACGVSTDF